MRLVGALAATFLFRGEVGNKTGQKCEGRWKPKRAEVGGTMENGGTEARRFRNSLMTCGSLEFNSFSNMSIDSLMTCWSSETV